MQQKERQSEDLDKAINEKRSKLNREKGSELLECRCRLGYRQVKSPEI
ncbi:MAG: hypothetical protein ACLURQ_15240 [Bacteroides thetaiotaomicron]